MNRIRRITLASTITASAILVACAIPASAETARSCAVSPDGYARLSVTRYAKGSGIEYHMDLNSSTPLVGVKYYQNEITISGVALPGTDDQYRDYLGTQTRTVRGYWILSSGQQMSCAVTL